MIEATTLFGKYQICRELGRGRSGTVYLAKHMELEEYRAIKRVPRSCADYKQFRKEALILKSIRHPGIPIVYDIFAGTGGDDCFYLVMEFLSGDSLFTHVSDMGHLSKAMTIRYGIQICHLVQVLHSARPTPILYLDLQPKNLLVCQDTIKLIDFDHSVHLDEAEGLTKRYGTVGCAAPEQYSGDTLDVRTDIYAIGTVLYFMLTGTYPECPPAMPRGIDYRLARVIRTCLKEEKEKRYPSVEALSKALELVQEQMKREERSSLGSGRISSLTIAVAGAERGVGTTHIAVGMTVFLRNCGYSALYEEKNDSGAVRQLASCFGVEEDERGICTVRGVPMLPCYGAAVALAPHLYPVRVLDFGTDRQSYFNENADGYVLVCGGKPWQWECTRGAVSDPGIHPGQAIIYNHFCRKLYDRLPGPVKETKCFLMPYVTNPFASEKEASTVYEAILLSLTGTKSGGILRKLSGKIRGLADRILRKKNGGP